MKKFIVGLTVLMMTSLAHASDEHSVQKAWNNYYKGVSNECFVGSMTLPGGKKYPTAWICVRYGNNSAMIGSRGSKAREQGFLISGTGKCTHQIKPYNKRRVLRRKECDGRILPNANALTVTALQQFLSLPQLEGGKTEGDYYVVKLKTHSPYTRVGYKVKNGTITSIRLYRGQRVDTTISLLQNSSGKKWRPNKLVFEQNGKKVTIVITKRTFNRSKCSFTTTSLKNGGASCRIKK